MQDRYAGDVGDFLNFALLRLLVAAPGATGSGDGPLGLGIIWYRVPDEDHNDDGKHVGYLEPGNRHGARLSGLDPDLYRRLAHVVATGRSVQAIERSGALPDGTVTHRALLDLRARTGPPATRLARRTRWVRRALDRVAGCDLVFADPDNGIRRADHPIARSAPAAGKHAYLDELAPVVERGQSLIVYHHADRSAPADEQIERRFDDLRTGFPGREPLAAVRASRGSTRFFLVVPSPAHVDRLGDRLRHIERSEWCAELRVVWPAAAAVRNSGQNRA